MTHQDAVRTMASERYLLGEMSAQEQDRFEAHYFACDACAEEMRLASVLREEMSAPAVPADAAPSPRAGVVVRRDVPAWRRAQVVLPWAVAASLALVVGYQSLPGVPGLAGVDQAYAGSPVVLRGQTRGADPIVPLAATQSSIVLAPDAIFDVPAETPLAWELRGPGGNTLVSERAAAPDRGNPLLFVVPTGLLAPAGRHVLVVRDAGDQRVLGEYAFVTDTK
jgi:anti-sigma factor RsiW